MIKLSLVRTWALKDFVRIARAKRGDRRKRLVGSARKIAKHFGAFDACTPAVETLTPGTLPKRLREDLIHAYDSRTKPLESLVAKLKLVGDEQPCQYCGINPEADTLDHYLEKHAYPEFSVFCRNLVPSCGRCNRDRRASVQNGARAVLNFRDDPIDQIPDLLSAQLIRAGRGFRARFHVKPPGSADHPIAAVYVRHFDSLRLAARFETVSAKELAVILQALVETQLPATRPSFSRERARRQLSLDAATLTKQFGLNDWKVALRRAAAASKEFLDACEDNWRPRATAN